MFVNCSEISINVIVKHVQHVEIIWSCSSPWDGLIFKFFSAWGIEKIAGWIGGLAGLLWRSIFGLNCDHLTSLKSKIFSLSTIVANVQLSSEKNSSYPSGAGGPKPMILWPYKNH